MKIIEGHLHAKDFKFAIVVSRFNDLITTKLLDGALDALLRHGAIQENISVFRVPGAYELPLVAKKLCTKSTFDAVICLGAVIRGDTPHFDYIASETAKGIASVSLEHGIPVSFGVITADTLEQALERAGSKSGNKGWDAAVSAIELADLYQKLVR
ncbi:6,7-dimethyl-8-ribityllumazine synthase [bacterium]|nr:6,7-dimethyl-8-ribityllumazine synthase [candidate division CSSED10-310 bacterium]